MRPLFDFDLESMSWPMCAAFICRAVGKGAHHLAPGHDLGVPEGGVDRIEPRVAVGAVDDGMEARMQIHRVVEVGEAEVGRVGLAVDGDVAQVSGVVAGGAEVAGDAFEVAEVGVIELVVAGDGRLAGIGNLPGTEDAHGVNGADRSRIGELGVEVHGGCWAGCR